MKTILVPTDLAFHDPALEYAIMLNKYLQGEIVLFHSVLVTNFEITNYAHRKKKSEAWKSSALQELNKIKNNLMTQNPGMQVSIATSNGWTSDQILVAEKSIKPDFIVMGKRNDNLLCEFLISSKCSMIIENSISPAIVVPSDSKIEPPHNIVYASNYEEDDYENIFSLIELARLVKSNVNLVHVITDEAQKTTEQIKLKSLTEKLIKETGYRQIQFNLIISKNIFTGISEYIDKSNADLLALSVRDRHMKFFGKSLTNKFSLQLAIPMIAFHTHTKNN